jgi:hypothetical protein
MILVLRALGVGDLATAVPALRGLRAAFPDHPLVLAAPGWLEPLVGLVGGVNRVVSTDGLEPFDWPGTQPYWAVNLHGRGPRSHRLLQAAEPVLLRAFECPAAGHADGPPWVDDEHEVRRWCRLMDWYGVPCDPADLGLRLPDPHRLGTGITVVHPGGKDARRRWAPDRFATIARELTRLGHQVVVTGSADERNLVRQVVESAGLPATAALAGHLDVTELAALVGYGRLVVSADTGVAHLATGYGTPSVVIFGPVRPDHWGPPADRPWHRALWAEELAGTHGVPEPVDRGPGAVDGGSAEPVLGGPGAVDTRPAQVVAGPAERPVAGPAPIHPALAAVGVDQVLDAVDDVERAGRSRRAVAAH